MVIDGRKEFETDVGAGKQCDGTESGPSVAQLVEHGACNARVVGSIPGTTHT